jgi:signal transduction histidine kinase
MQVAQFENRNVCADGSIRWLQWNARAVPEEGLIYAVARDTTQSRRVAEEQSALRRLATLVARGGAPLAVLGIVAEEAGRLISADFAMIARYDAGSSATGVVAWRRDGEAVLLGTNIKLGGRNVASSVFRTGRPARVDNYETGSGDVAAWARRTGIQSSVGVPIMVEGRLWGVMTVSLEHERALPPDTEDRLSGFTELAATAVANAEAREKLKRVADEQSALRRVATLVARGVAPELVFSAVAEEVANLLPAVDLALVGRYQADAAIEFVGAWSSAGAAEWIGQMLSVGGNNVTTKVFETKQPARVDTLDDASMATTFAQRSGIRSGAGAPINVEGQLWGLIIVCSRHEAKLPVGIEHELAGFTELVASAIANAQAQADLAASRARVVASADETRRKIERDLHDGAQAQLVALALQVRAAQAVLPPDHELAAELDVIAARLTSALAELRELASGIHPPVLAAGGLGPAVRTLGRRFRIPVDIHVRTCGRLPEPLEVGAYYVVSEALTNAVKHSEATSITVDIEAADDVLQICVRDDGVGGAEFGRGSGLLGLRDRVEALGGRIVLRSKRGAGTSLSVELPLAPDRAGVAG